MLTETDLIPYSSSPPVGERVLILAPHPDDESLGCGGAIRLLIEAGREVRVVFLTSGDKADPSDPSSKVVYGEPHHTEYARMREEEAKEALAVLGVGSYEFLRFPDRQVHERQQEIMQRLAAITDLLKPDNVYSPSPVEPHPDHRAAASIALALQRRAGNDPAEMSLVFYEVAVPMRPNMLVEVTSVFDVKRKAIGRYRSQLRLIDYLRTVTAINTMRTLTLGGEGYAEAYWHLGFPWTAEQMSDWLCYRSPILERA